MMGQFWFSHSLSPKGMLLPRAIEGPNGYSKKKKITALNERAALEDKIQISGKNYRANIFANFYK